MISATDQIKLNLFNSDPVWTAAISIQSTPKGLTKLILHLISNHKRMHPLQKSTEHIDQILPMIIQTDQCHCHAIMKMVTSYKRPVGHCSSKKNIGEQIFEELMDTILKKKHQLLSFETHENFDSMSRLLLHKFMSACLLEICLKNLICF